MRVSRWLVAALALTLFAMTPFACGGGSDNATGNTQCSDGKDNDGDGTKDFPNDPSCDSEDDDTEDGPASPECSDGKDNDGDGQIDYPNDSSGCTAASDVEEFTSNPIACGGGII